MKSQNFAIIITIIIDLIIGSIILLISFQILMTIASFLAKSPRFYEEWIWIAPIFALNALISSFVVYLIGKSRSLHGSFPIAFFISILASGIFLIIVHSS